MSSPQITVTALSANESATTQELRDALARLSNEVLGSLPLMEPLARREFGNSNYNILLQRAEEARALLNRGAGS